MDAGDVAVAWGIMGGELFGIINVEIIKQGPEVRQEDWINLLTLWGATGAIGGFIGELFLREYFSLNTASLMGGVAMTWLLILVAKSF